jgi:hypothetical protein
MMNKTIVVIGNFDNDFSTKGTHNPLVECSIHSSPTLWNKGFSPNGKISFLLGVRMVPLRFTSCHFLIP